MRRATILHYLTQWMWLSDSFVFGPIAVSRYRTCAVSRMQVINSGIYPPPQKIITLEPEAPAEGADSAAAVLDKLGPVQPDLVHLHHGYSLPDATAVAAVLHVPLVVSFWGYDVTSLPQREPHRVIPYLDAADVTLVPSKFLADVVLSLGVSAQRLRVLPGSVDGRFFQSAPLPPEPFVTFVGRFVAKKGIDVLLAAWTEVRRAVPTAELTVVGYGETAPHAEPGLGIRVVSPDPADPRGQVHDVIRGCRVYVAPSRTGPDGDSESQHIGNLEAQSAGRVVVTTDHGPIPEFVEDGTTGIVVPQGDPSALATALIAALTDMPLAERLARNAALAARRRRGVPGGAR
jgi:colanic acid/amylovoran biosynthesis glycosyltransferase